MQAPWSCSRYLALGLVAAAGLAFLAASVRAQEAARQEESVEALEQRLPQLAGAERAQTLCRLTDLLRGEAPRRAVAYGEEALELFARHPDPVLEVATWNEMAWAYMLLGEHEKAIEHAERGRQLAESSGDRRGLARAVNNLGVIARRQGRPDQAIAHFEQSLEVRRELGSQAEVAMSMNNLGVVYSLDMAEYERALEYHLDALRIRERLGDPADMALSLSNIAGVLARTGKPREALEHHQRALDMRRQLGIEHKIALTLAVMAEIHLDLGEAEPALTYALEALELSSRTDGKSTIALALQLAGMAYAAQGSYAQARFHLERSLAVCEELGERQPLALGLLRLAALDRETGRLDGASDQAARALQVARDMSSLALERDAREELSRIHEAAGRPGLALEEHKAFKEISDRMLEAQRAKRIERLEILFDTERRERRIERLESERALQRLELGSQHRLRRALIAGFGLLLAVLGLLFNRYRLKSREGHMHAAVDREREANLRLRQLDQLKDEFLANTSHELRTPLYGITGLAESLIDGSTGELPATTKANLSMIVHSGQRLSRLVDDLLDFSKLRHKSLELDLRPVDLRPLVEVVLELSRPLVGSKTLKLENAVPPDLPPAMADENRLQQILHNLVANALKFTKAGKVEVSAAVAGGRVSVRVADTGIGIPQEQQARIFGAFEQVDASVEREYSGTGLGLAVTRQLVELHGGEIRVESTPGEGSVFSFTLPLAAADADDDAPAEAGEPEAAATRIAPPPPAAAAPADEAPAASGEPLAAGVTSGRARILAVDDDPINLRILRHYLEVEPFDLTLASSGEEALQRIGEQRFDLVLLDVMMPRMSGYEVCRALRRRYPAQELPVLFLTARARQEDQLAGLAEGANDYLTKPVARETLLARVRLHVGLLEAHRKQLAGLVPICAQCKKIRDDEGYWEQIEAFLASRTDLYFSHGLCPACLTAALAEVKALKEAEVPWNRSR